LRFLIVQDHKENRRKCSLTPLEGRADFTFVRLKSPAWVPGKAEVGSGILLSIGAPELSRVDASLLDGGGSLVLLDSTWARLSSLSKRITVASGARLESRSIPPGVMTAYPRVSKVHEEPAGGLASVEALFAASVFLGEPRPDLLADYLWADEFLRKNGWLALATLPSSRVC
jgi:pre-rRNA-processing protein TSR3